MPDNFDLYPMTDADVDLELDELLASMDEASWIDEVDPWLLDDDFDE